MGFATYDEVKKAVEGDEQQKLDLFSDMQSIDEGARDAGRQFQLFRLMQTEHDMDAAQFKDAKVKVKKSLGELNDKLNIYLSKEQGIETKSPKAFEKWLKSHQPFHWFVEFYRIIKDGGFDVIIGNPPYVEYSKVRKTYSLPESFKTVSCGNLYALVLERSYQLLRKTSKSGFIIPLSIACTKRMEQLRILQQKQNIWFSCYDMRPGSLFEGVAQRLCILLGSYSARGKVAGFHTGGYRRWKAPERPSLLSTLGYTQYDFPQYDNFPKLKDDIEVRILNKLSGSSIQNFCDSLSEPIFVHRIVRYFIKAFDFTPVFVDANGKPGKSDDYKPFKFIESQREPINALLNSNMFYWFWRLHSDGFHCGYNDVFLLPYDGEMKTSIKDSLSKLNQILMNDLQNGSVEKTISTKTGKISYQEFSPKQSICVINQIDSVLAEHYDFSQEELDFILNYDIKYRMGLDSFEGT